MSRTKIASAVGAGTVLALCAIPAYAYVQQSIRSKARVQAAQLTAPEVSTALNGSDVLVTPSPGQESAPPSYYSVELVGVDGAGKALCDKVTGKECVDAAPPAATRAYRATAHLGQHWVRTSAVVRTYTAPPKPTVALSPDATGGETTITVSAPPGSDDYSLVVQVDGTSNQVADLIVRPRDPATRIVKLPKFPAGHHAVAVVAKFHTAVSASALLGISVEANGSITKDPVASEGSPPGNGTAEATWTLEDTDHDGAVGVGDSVIVGLGPLATKALCSTWTLPTSGQGTGDSAPTSRPVSVSLQRSHATAASAKVVVEPTSEDCEDTPRLSFDLGQVAVSGALEPGVHEFDASELRINEDRKSITVKLGRSNPVGSPPAETTSTSATTAPPTPPSDTTSTAAPAPSTMAP